VELPRQVASGLRTEPAARTIENRISQVNLPRIGQPLHPRSAVDMPADEIELGLIFHRHLSHVQPDADAERLHIWMRVVKRRGLLLNPKRTIHRR